MATLDRSLARRVVLATVIALSVAGAGVVLAVFRRFFILVLLGLVFTELFQAIADPLHRRLGGPRGLWIAVSVLIVLGAVAGIVALSLYPLEQQLSRLVSDLPGVAGKLTERAERLSRFLGRRHGQVPLAGLVATRLADMVVSGGSVALVAVEGFFEALAVLSLGIFVAMTPRAHFEGFLNLLPPGFRGRGARFVSEARHLLREWMVGVSLSMAIMGAIATSGLWFIGVPYFLVFGILAGAMELIPYVGPVLAFSAPTAFCLATDPRKAISCGIFYVIAHGVEANIVVPLVARKRAGLPPSLVVLSILVSGALAGIVGLIAATPLLAVTIAAVRELWIAPVDMVVERPMRAAA
jgi:predicted PurR-regulated permease PerM